MNKILKFGLLAIYPHAKFEKAAPVTIEMFDKSKLTTSTKVSSLHLVTTVGVLTLKAKKVVSNSSFNRIQETNLEEFF